MLLARESLRKTLEDFNLKSYSVDQLLKAADQGQTLFWFDSGTSGNDDILIGWPGEIEDDIQRELMEFYELSEWPNWWTLEEIEFF